MHGCGTLSAVLPIQQPLPALQPRLREGGGMPLFQLLDSKEIWNSSYTPLP